MYQIFFTYSSIEEHLGCFQFLPIMNKAAVNVIEQVFLWDVGACSGYVPSSGIAVSSGRTSSKFLRSYQIDLSLSLSLSLWCVFFCFCFGGLFVLFCFVFKIWFLCIAWLSWKSLCRGGWPWIRNLPAFASQVCWKPNWFLKQLYKFILPPAMEEWLPCSIMPSLK